VYQRGSLLDGLAMYLSCDTKKFQDNESTHILHNFWTATHRGESSPPPGGATDADKPTAAPHARPVRVTSGASCVNGASVDGPPSFLLPTWQRVTATINSRQRLRDASQLFPYHSSPPQSCLVTVSSTKFYVQKRYAVISVTVRKRS